MPVALGPFVLDAPIGRGGMGEVWRARHLGQGLPVAVKVVHARLAERPEARAAFRDEVRAVARLDHPGVVWVYEHGEVPEAAAAAEPRLAAGSPYLVMELATGGTLESAPPPRDWEDARAVLAALLDALAHAHARGVVHRDVKPANVLVGGPTDPRPGLKLTDFGIAGALEAHDPVRTVAGTPGYMAPEQLESRWRDVGPWTDLYALGVLGWELVTGESPFDGAAPTAAWRWEPPPLAPRVPVPRGLEGWLACLLQPDPARRHPTAADAAAALAALGPAALPPGPGGGGRRRVASPTLLLGRPDDGAALPLAPEADGAGPPLVARPVPASGTAAHSPPPAPFVDAGLGLSALRVPPLVGREAELGRLWAALRAVAEGGRPGAVVLGGPVGVGRSRLGDQLAERAHELGVATVVRVVHGPTPGPGDGVVGAFDRRLGTVRLEPERVGRRVARALAALGVFDPAEAAALAAALRPDEAEGEGGGEPAAERRGALLRHVARLARLRPLVVWIDDAQWGADALRFAEAVLAGEAPVLVVAAVGDDGLADPAVRAAVEALVSRPGVERVDLAPLGEDDARALARELLRLDGDALDRLWASAAGNPLAIVQTVAHWVERGALVSGPGGFRLRPGAADLPEDPDAAWIVRVERRFPAPAVEALEAAAVLATELDAAAWSQLAAARGVDADALREGLLGDGLARPSGGGWRFAHAGLRTALQRRAARAGRAAGHHAACAALLADQPGGRARARRAVHLLEAGAGDEAVDALLGAARAAVRDDDHASARSLLERRAALLDRLGAPAVDPRRAAGDLVLAQTLTRLQDYARAGALAAAAWASATAHGWEAVAVDAAYRAGEVARTRADLPDAAAWFERAADLARARGDRYAWARAERNRAKVAVLRGDAAAARRHLEAALPVFAAAGDRFAEGVVWTSMGDIERLDRRWDAAEAAFGRALALHREVGNRTGEVVCRLGLAEVMRFRGDLDRAEATYREVLPLNERLGRDSLVIRLNVALCQLARGRWAEARPVLEEVRDACARRGRRGVLACAQVALLPCYAADADWEAWDAALADAEVLLAATRMADPDLCWPAERAAALAAAAGEGARARRAAALAEEQGRRLGAGPSGG